MGFFSSFQRGPMSRSPFPFAVGGFYDVVARLLETVRTFGWTGIQNSLSLSSVAC